MEIRNKNNCSQFVAQDKAIVREIVSPRNSSVKNQSIAEVIILPNTSILEHYHEKAEEIYYILSGKGHMMIDGENRIVLEEDTVIILPGQKHKICNKSNVELVMLVTCSPCYTDEDQILVE